MTTTERTNMTDKEIAQEFARRHGTGLDAARLIGGRPRAVHRVCNGLNVDRKIIEKMLNQLRHKDMEPAEIVEELFALYEGADQAVEATGINAVTLRRIKAGKQTPPPGLLHHLKACLAEARRVKIQAPVVSPFGKVAA